MSAPPQWKAKPTVFTVVQGEGVQTLLHMSLLRISGLELSDAVRRITREFLSTGGITLSAYMELTNLVIDWWKPAHASARGPILTPSTVFPTRKTTEEDFARALSMTRKNPACLPQRRTAMYPHGAFTCTSPAAYASPAALSFMTSLSASLRSTRDSAVTPALDCISPRASVPLKTLEAWVTGWWDHTHHE